MDREFRALVRGRQKAAFVALISRASPFPVSRSHEREAVGLSFSHPPLASSPSANFAGWRTVPPPLLD